MRLAARAAPPKSILYSVHSYLLARLGGIVPHTHGAVDAAGEQQRLLGADVDAGDCLVVEAARKVG